MTNVDLQLPLIDIDFLPEKYREENARRKEKGWRYVVIGVFSVLVLLAGSLQQTLRHNLAAELKLVGQQHESAETRMSRLTQLQKDQIHERRRAELVNYLNHPWPRTQILAAVVEPLPKSIRLSEIRLSHEAQQQPGARAERASSKLAAATTSAPAKDPVQQDLEQLRSEGENRATMVTLSGETTDLAALHFYLGKLGEHRLIAKAELRSLERSQRDAERSLFRARLTIRAPYGAPDGPSPPAEVAAAAGQNRATAPLSTLSSHPGGAPHGHE